VGLARAEFIITIHIGIHPMALVRYPNLKSRQVVKDIAGRIGSEDARAFFVRRLSEGIGRFAGRRSNDDQRGSAMNPPKRILVPLDVSEQSAPALECRRCLATHWRSLDPPHVVPNPYLADPSGITER
jgi:hypothetical protein